jgi:hypothetical protein
MADEVENAIKQTANKIVEYVKDAATLSVETKFVTIASDGGPADFGGAKPAARTVIKLDGDCEAIIPMQATETGLAVDRSLFELHERSLNAAIEYRTKLLNSLLSTLQGLNK